MSEKAAYLDLERSIEAAESYSVHRWMTKVVDKSTQLCVYAIIYRCAELGGPYVGGSKLIAESTMLALRTVQQVTHEMIRSGVLLSLDSNSDSAGVHGATKRLTVNGELIPDGVRGQFNASHAPNDASHALNQFDASGALNGASHAPNGSEFNASHAPNDASHALNQFDASGALNGASHAPNGSEFNASHAPNDASHALNQFDASGALNGASHAPNGSEFNASHAPNDASHALNQFDASGALNGASHAPNDASHAPNSPYIDISNRYIVERLDGRLDKQPTNQPDSTREELQVDAESVEAYRRLTAMSVNRNRIDDTWEPFCALLKTGLTGEEICAAWKARQLRAREDGADDRYMPQLRKWLVGDPKAGYAGADIAAIRHAAEGSSQSGPRLLRTTENWMVVSSGAPEIVTDSNGHAVSPDTPREQVEAMLETRCVQ